MRRKSSQERLVFNDIEIIDIAEEGKGVGKTDDLVLFVEKAIPGDVVDVELLRKKKSFGEGRIQTLKKASEHRVEPFCEHFGVCGGCKWQHMTYDAQLLFKQQSVENALTRIGKVDTSSMEPILASGQTEYYRNKLEYTFSNKKWLTSVDDNVDGMNMDALGFHVPGRFDKILNVNHCYLQEDPSNVLRNSVREFAIANDISFYDLRGHSGVLRNLIIRISSTGELMVIVVFAYPEEGQVELLMSFIQEKFPSITSLLYIINQKKNDTIFDQEIEIYNGRDFIYEEMEGLKFKVGPKSFYQTNSAQAYELYKITRDFAGLSGHELVYDLYTGAGTIANFVAKYAKEVIGVEYVPSAIEDAKINSEINGVKNTKFYAGDMKDVLTAHFIAQHGKPDVVITDPPRAGMHTDVVARLLEMEAPKIVYVSCNAATQARDLTLLAEKYDVVRIKPVDMFPHTQHVENVVLLKLKG
ncbi:MULTISPECIES: 23S rRNA (uracil(1939)-C(5))-methyltransferase RlmD [Sphingobacterium]|jgi:23S rRNA (uracil1939-C5)-methyltransferase|uniref:23S rRNA (uracil(1939)-C(5))-methyltransferase RlmD n=1 Tax=Sphingobacterium TaxID=28453 RepID=UPI00097F0A11|nr:MULTISPECIES: 23S rRNA (uracil(1939)-C(5))-methyltransferase RlmD [Sphingobacterium]UPZ37362.1 23S rRNA (uracil(1939)-C(5))-methyltransferase RlmD [Sphingobacterium sp. PCS056]WGQ16591.1 23S rRNA (uracil(1939)-C(5))-methyltransferase RlmD [Sphingobacterium faecium]SJN20587.1 RNA methyltransferase, TrmA family [Sphingobacterium faecium PCAi_F2.5]HCU45145.1 23S rRNA (uracil(1939)-C(5))-methyltransferase RlmD [Sphingobacterium sp.]